MDRILVTSDIHGCYIEFNELLKKAAYNPDRDRLILVGDFIDRGPFSRQVVEQVIGLVRNNGAIAIRGNHDQMFVDAIRRGWDHDLIRNGGMNTMDSYAGETVEDTPMYWDTKQKIKIEYMHHVDFLESLPLYYETDDHIFVHAGINPTYNDFDWTTQSQDDFLWIRDEFLDSPTKLSKIVIHGHTPTSNFQETGDIIFSKDKINIDGGGVFGYQFNMLAIMDSGYREFYVKGKRYL